MSFERELIGQSAVSIIDFANPTVSITHRFEQNSNKSGKKLIHECYSNERADLNQQVIGVLTSTPLTHPDNKVRECIIQISFKLKSQKQMYESEHH